MIKKFIGCLLTHHKYNCLTQAREGPLNSALACLADKAFLLHFLLYLVLVSCSCGHVLERKDNQHSFVVWFLHLENYYYYYYSTTNLILGCWSVTFPLFAMTSWKNSSTASASALVHFLFTYTSDQIKVSVILTNICHSFTHLLLLLASLLFTTASLLTVDVDVDDAVSALKFLMVQNMSCLLHLCRTLWPGSDSCWFQCRGSFAWLQCTFFAQSNS